MAKEIAGQVTVVGLAGMFAALADPTRLRLLHLLNGREVCVCYFVEVLGEGQPKVSRHLAYLRRAGLVAARREGTWMHYSLVRPDGEGAALVLDAALAACAGSPGMAADVARLKKACCVGASGGLVRLR